MTQPAIAHKIRHYFRLCLFVAVALMSALTISFTSSTATAQSPKLPTVLTPPTVRPTIPPLNTLNDPTRTEWITIDGRRIFQIAALQDNITERTAEINRNLDRITRNYYSRPSNELNIDVRETNNLPTIYINDQYLLSVTDLDARLRRLDSRTWAEQLSQILDDRLTRAHAERQPRYYRQAAQISAGILGLSALVSFLLQHYIRRDKSQSNQLVATTAIVNRNAVRDELLHTSQYLVWTVGLLLCLEQFPQTRPVSQWVIQQTPIPFKLLIIAVITYTVIRLSYRLINWLQSTHSIRRLLSPIEQERLDLRISTISTVAKGVTAFSLIGCGLLTALILFGVDVFTLVAGLGLVGVAVSLASQSLIKDAINGFLIIFEDQFGVGDLIKVGAFSGIVENMTLRITQIRSADGQLITIPNSEIKTIANLSSAWARVDLNIPIAYESDVETALQLIETTALSLQQDPAWSGHILEAPQVMGVEDFSERGMMIKLWIKTLPFQQMPIAREYRRRLKIAFDQAGIVIPTAVNHPATEAAAIPREKTAIED